MIKLKSNFSETSNPITEIEQIAHEKNLTLVRGICLPATCTKKKVIEYWNQKNDFRAIGADCRTNDPIGFNAIDIFAL